MLRTLALAAVAATLMAAPATASEYRVSAANLHTPEGVAKFDQKVSRISRELCAGRIGVSRANCFNAVREEALEQLPRNQRLAYNQARNSQSIETVALRNANAG